MSRHKSPPMPVLVAAALLLISLGFPWATQAGSDSIYSPGAYIPGSCINVTGWDGYMTTECTPGQVMVGLYFPGTDGTIVSGRMHPGRFALVGGLVLIIAGIRTRNRRYFGAAALVVPIITVLTGGLAPLTSGVMMALLASLLLGVAAGFRPLPQRRFTDQRASAGLR
jgi:hypothetical protein